MARRLDCPHRIEVVYADGASQAASFDVPEAAGPALRVELHPAEPNATIFRATDRRYRQVMASCLKNLLAELGR